MPGMPATKDSARFVGRDAAFVRLAPALEAAAAGDATTVLIDGPGGVGVTRFVDELGRRVGRLDEPFRVVRGRSFRPGSDEPYGPIVRALRPVFRAAVGRRAGAPRGTRGGGRRPPLPRARRPALARPGRCRIGPPRPRSSAARAGCSRACSAWSAGCPSGSRSCSSSRTSTTPTPAPARSSRSSAGSGGHHRVCLIGTLQTDELTRDHPLNRTLAEMPAAGGPRPGPDRDPAVRSVRAGGARPGDRGRAADRLRARPRRRSRRAACRSSPRSCSRPGASCPTRRSTGSFADLVIARLARHGPECRRVLRLLALAGRPVDRDELADDGSRLRADRRSPPAAVVDPAAARRRGPRPGSRRRSRGGARGRHPRRGGRRDRLPPRAHPAGGGRRTSCRASGTATTSRSRPGSSPIRARRRATGWRPTSPDRAFAAAVDAAGPGRGRPRARGRPRGARARARLVEPRPRRRDRAVPAPDREQTATRRRRSGEDPESRRRSSSGPPRRRSRPAVPPAPSPTSRRSSAAFDERRDRVALGLLHERLGRYRRAAGDRGRRPRRPRAGRRAGPGRADPRAGDRSSRRSPRRRCSTARSPTRSGSPARRSGSARAVGRRRRGDRRPRDDDARRLARLGRRPRGRRRPARGGARPGRAGRRRRRAVPGLRQPDDGPRSRRPAGRGGRRSPTRASRPAGEAGLEAVYGNFLRGNASDSLYLLGRWDESSAISATALEWSPAGVAFARPIDSLAIVEIETRAGESAGRRLGQMLVELETVSDAQHAVPIYRAAASLALWQGDHADAESGGRPAAGTSSKDSEDWSLIAKMAATVAEVDSMAAADAGARRDLATLATIRGRSRDGRPGRRPRRSSASGVGPTIGSRREADAWLALADGPPRSARGPRRPRGLGPARGRLARRSANPYEVAKARWRAGGGDPRPAARAGRAAAGPGRRSRRRRGSRVSLSARPLLREIRELAGRAMIRLPELVDELLDAPERLALAAGSRPARRRGRRGSSRSGPADGRARRRGRRRGRRRPAAATADGAGSTRLSRSSAASSARRRSRSATRSGCRAASARCSP